MKKILVALIVLVVLAALGAGGYFVYLNYFQSEEKTTTKVGETEKCGELKKDETWSGNINVTCNVTVPEGIVLSIEAGSVVKFKYDRDYKTFDRAGLEVNGGTIKALGKKDKQIWFTSDAKDPINGDWWGIGINNSKDSKFDYVIVEFGEMGIEQFDSSVPVTNSIIRWINAEGLYAERSSPVFKNNTLYQNGYHDIALEQYNKNVQILNNVFKGGRYSIHHEKTTSHIEGNYFTNYSEEVISAGMESSITVKKNKFEKVDKEKVFSIDPNSKAKISGSDFGSSGVAIPKFDYKDIKKHELGYTPGDTKDKFPYVYDDVDKTRKVVKKIGKDLSFGWALVYANDYLWRFSLGSGEVGESLDFIRVNPKSGKYERFGNNTIMNPRGLTWDGEYFWVNDFSLLKIYKFKLDGNFIKIVGSFDIPDKERGGTNGLTSDGEFLYLRSRYGSKVYKLDKSGKVVDSIEMEGGTFVWTGKHFWVAGGCDKGICKYTKEGKLVGEIYPAAEGTWGIAWDGKYLWTLQRTCELWNDPKMYQIEILDDSLN